MEEIHEGYTTFKSRDNLENKLIYIVYIPTYIECSQNVETYQVI